ncbi:DUF5996 family protein, partial [Streptomyces niveus]|uniref:DUF5996 family protein n=1 Tax=Streptomyces niveus TaxID=193462 RepID=UPI0033FF0B91
MPGGRESVGGGPRLAGEQRRTADDPDRALAGFLRSTYAAAADGAGWDRASL